MLRDTTHHSGTLFHGTGLYNDKQHTMIYTVISADQVKKTIKLTKEIDPKAFINVLKQNASQAIFISSRTTDITFRRI